MRRTVDYPYAVFDAEVIKHALAVGGLSGESKNNRHTYKVIGRKNEKWYFEDDTEFFAEYRKDSLMRSTRLKTGTRVLT